MNASVACATCAFFDHQPGTPVGLCRFLPPTAAAIPLQKPGLDGKMHLEVQQVNVWANTRPEDWCAQHRHRASSQPVAPAATQPSQQAMTTAIPKCAEESRKPSPALLDLAEQCGAELTGKPNGSEAIMIVFSIAAWRSFDAALYERGGLSL